MMRKNGYPLNTSIPALFVSGILPGLIPRVGLVNAWHLQICGITLPSVAPAPMKERLRVTARAFWALLMPVIIIGGMKSGIFILPGSRRGGRRLCPVHLVYCSPCSKEY
jgi:TRAP-type C4-dicarboxylate transport system permease large subunit